MAKLFFKVAIWLAYLSTTSTAFGLHSLSGKGSQLNETASLGCQQACTNLATKFGSSLHYPSNDNFTIWDEKQQEVTPACRVEPASAEHVSLILGVLVDSWCHFAVKGGGHSREAGDSNAVAGVTIDLARLATVEIATDGTSARVGGGANIAQTYTALQARNLSYVGGRVGTVGMGGFNLGGGTSPFANKYGWALDNIYEYEIVLANGTITRVTEDSHADLYFALRGGGNNFGIVTTYTIRAFPGQPVFRGNTAYGDNHTEQVLDGIYHLFTDPDASSDVNVGYDMFYTYNVSADQFMMMGTQWYDAPIANSSVFQSLNSIPSIFSTGTIQPMARMVGGPGPLPPGTVRHLFATFTTLPSRPLLTEAVSIFKEEVRAVRTVEGLAPNFICYSLPKNAIAAMKRRGGNALGINNEGPLFIYLISTGWSDAQGDMAIRTMTANIVQRIEQKAKVFGVDHKYRYINYGSAAQAKGIFTGYGEESLQKLVEIQKAVDPKGMFTSRGLWKGFMKLS